MEALRTHQERIRFVQVRHEEAAAFMACGYTKFTGRLGVCLATSGPGGKHLLNGLLDAKIDGRPCSPFTGMPYHDLNGTHTQQEVELDRLYMDVTAYNTAHQRPNSRCGHALNLYGSDGACLSEGEHLTFPVDIPGGGTKNPPTQSKGAIPHSRSLAGHFPMLAELAVPPNILQCGKKNDDSSGPRRAPRY